MPGALHSGRTSIPTNAHEPAASFFDRLRESSGALLRNIASECELASIGIGAPNANIKEPSKIHPTSHGDASTCVPNSANTSTFRLR
jgi:hypothetical protein